THREHREAEQHDPPPLEGLGESRLCPTTAQNAGISRAGCGGVDTVRAVPQAESPGALRSLRASLPLAAGARPPRRPCHMPRVGLAPTWACARAILSRVRLPFRHPGAVNKYNACARFTPGLSAAPGPPA